MSQLLLGAIERDDLAEVQRLANEGSNLIGTIEPSFRGASDRETRETLDDVRKMNARVVERLGEWRDQVAAELSRLGAARARLRLLRPLGPHDSELIERDS